MNQTPNADRPDPGVPHLRRAVYIYTALTIIGILVVVALSPWIFTWTPLVSLRASDNFLTLIVFTCVAMPVFMFVMVFGFYNLFAFRPRGRPERDGPPIVASRTAIIAWVGITTAHAVALFIWGLIFLGRADAAPAPQLKVLQVYVTGEQWQFNFTYPQYGNAQSEILELPVNQPVYFTITSLDVVHSFSVPALGFKEDAVPGIFTHIRTTPSAIGTYSLRCFELCGIYHTYMEAPVHVVNPADFTSWVGSLKVHGYPWGINGAGAPNGAPPSPYQAPTGNIAGPPSA
ncbi:MAG TPA: cytochrome c oxidase subunit II, partial [Ktedonobacterales bacterium]|nr:cytochrome c oxidase subunit II [Ktedonobacterales bacterium]